MCYRDSILLITDVGTCTGDVKEAFRWQNQFKQERIESKYTRT